MVTAFLKATAAAAEFVFALVKDSSETLELKLAFEGLAKTMGVNTGLLGDLKRATEGLVPGSVLLRNANRILTAEIPLTTAQYSKMVEAVFKLSKASGVDAAQALNTLTDSLVRGNARGFQALGMNVGHVKDAISQMAEAMGQSSSKMENDARLRTFYIELSKALSAAAARNATDYFSLADALTKAELSWKSLLSGMGQAAGRSGVLEELLKKFSHWLDEVVLKEDGINRIAWAVNGWIIGMLKGLSMITAALAAFVAPWELAWNSAKSIFNTAMTVMLGGLWAIQEGLASFLELLAKIPGSARLGIGELAATSRDLADALSRELKDSARDALHSFDGTGETAKKLWAMHQSLSALVSEMEKFSGVVVHGEGGSRKLATASEEAAAAVKKLQEQQKEYDSLWYELGSRLANERDAALMKYQEDIRKINRFTELGSEQRMSIWLRALEAYHRKLNEITEKEKAQEIERQVALTRVEHDQQQERLKQSLAFWKRYYWDPIQEQIEADKKKEELRQKEVNHVLATASTLERSVELAQRGKLGASIGESALKQLPSIIEQVKQKIAELENIDVLSNEQWEDLFKLYGALDRLNYLNMTPFQQHLETLKNHLHDIGASMTEAWGGFWADLVSGQENAGKKFLAALLNIVSGELMIWAVEETAHAIRAAAMLDFAGAARHAAAAAAIGALAGTIKGFATSLSQASQAAPVAVAQDPPRTASQVQVIEVGSARGAQNPGQAAASQQPVQADIRCASSRAGTLWSARSKTTTAATAGCDWCCKMANFPSDPKPDYPVEEAPSVPEVLVTVHRDGSQQRRLKGAGKGATFRLSFGGSCPVTKSQRDAVLNHFAGQSGTLTAFSWTHPERSTETYLVRYSEAPSARLVGYNAYTLEVQLEVVTA